MKRLLLSVLAFTALFSFSGCSRDEKTAIEEFKKDITSFKTWSDERQKAFKDPMDALSSFGELANKMKAIKTDGLPADIKDPWTGLIGGLDKMVALTSSLPKDPAEMAKKMQDPNALKDFMPKMMAISEEVKPYMEKLKEAGKKYGIDNLDGVGPH